MTYNVWPFLIGCNKDVDYRTILVPSIINKVEASETLAKAALGSKTSDNKVIRKKIRLFSEDYYIFYIVYEANNNDLGLKSNKILRDDWGRIIYLIRGFIIKDIKDIHTDFKVGSKLFNNLKNSTDLFFQMFWKNTNRKWNAIESDSFQYDPLAETLFFEIIDTETSKVSSALISQNNIQLNKSIWSYDFSIELTKLLNTNINPNKLLLNFHGNNSENLLIYHKDKTFLYNIVKNETTKKWFHGEHDLNFSVCYYTNEPDFKEDNLLLYGDNTLWDIYGKNSKLLNSKINYSITSILVFVIKGEIYSDMLYAVTGDSSGVIRIHDFLEKNNSMYLKHVEQPKGKVKVDNFPILSIFYNSIENSLYTSTEKGIYVFSLNNYDNPEKICAVLINEKNIHIEYKVIKSQFFFHGMRLYLVNLTKEGIIYLYIVLDKSSTIELKLIDEISDNDNKITDFSVASNGKYLANVIHSNNKCYFKIYKLKL